MYLDEVKVSDNVQVYKAVTLLTNDINEIVYQTSDGYVLSILEEIAT